MGSGQKAWADELAEEEQEKADKEYEAWRKKTLKEVGAWLDKSRNSKDDKLVILYAPFHGKLVIKTQSKVIIGDVYE